MLMKKSFCFENNISLEGHSAYAFSSDCRFVNFVKLCAIERSRLEYGLVVALAASDCSHREVITSSKVC